MYREAAKQTEKQVKIILSYDEVRRICKKELQAQGMMPPDSELITCDFADHLKNQEWVSSIHVTSGQLIKTIDPLLGIEFRTKIVE